jgi:hypothetical protein
MKLNLKYMNWIGLARSRCQWRALLVNAAMSTGYFMSNLIIDYFSKMVELRVAR